MRITAYGIYICTPSEQQRNEIVAAMRMSTTTQVKMPCGSTFQIGDLEPRWYLVLCPCGDSSHVMVEVRKNLQHGIAIGVQ